MKTQAAATEPNALETQIMARIDAACALVRSTRIVRDKIPTHSVKWYPAHLECRKAAQEKEAAYRLAFDAGIMRKPYWM